MEGSGDVIEVAAHSDDLAKQAAGNFVHVPPGAATTIKRGCSLQVAVGRLDEVPECRPARHGPLPVSKTWI
jgi:hypothetical protein